MGILYKYRSLRINIVQVVEIVITDVNVIEVIHLTFELGFLYVLINNIVLVTLVDLKFGKSQLCLRKIINQKCLRDISNDSSDALFVSISQTIIISGSN